MMKFVIELNKSKKLGITDINYNFSRIRIYSYNSLPIEKMLTFYNIIILIIIKPVFNKNEKNCHYKIFLEKTNTHYF